MTVRLSGGSGYGLVDVRIGFRFLVGGNCFSLRYGIQKGPGADAVCYAVGRLRLKCDGTRVETRFRLWPKRTSPFKSAEASVQSTTGGRAVRINGSNAGYTMFRGSVKSTGYPLHSPVSPSIPLPCVTVCHHISTTLYYPLLFHGSIVYANASHCCVYTHIACVFIHCYPKS